MFITLQFPLIDFRFLKTKPEVAEKPRWPLPEENESMRYVGRILRRSLPYFGPWDDEKKYCDARHVINFCGLDQTNFYKAFHQQTKQSRILFRRFQSTGKFLSKFEIGFNDYSEHHFTGRRNRGQDVDFNKLIIDAISSYLNCPVKIKVKDNLTDYVPLIESSSLLRDAYFWSTHTGDNHFTSKDISKLVTFGDPIAIVQIDSSYTDLSSFEKQLVDAPFLKEQGIALYYCNLPVKENRNVYYIKTWLIDVYATKNTLGLNSKDFSSAKYNDVLRYLRINLLRIHCEKVALRQILETIGNPTQEFLIKDDQTKDKVYFFLHKLLLNLSKSNRNNQPQEKLIELAFRADEQYNNHETLEEQVKGLEIVIDWLKNLKFKNEVTQIFNFLENSKATIMNNNNSFNNNSNSTIIVDSIITESFNKIKDALGEAEAKIISKVTNDVVASGNKEAIENMKDFHEEVQKEKPKSSRLKAFWTAIVAAVPAVLVNSDKVLGIIEKIGKMVTG